MLVNEGMTDRIIRLIVGAIFIILGINLSYWWYVPGAILLFTALTGHCRIYSWLDIDTLHPVMKKRKIKKR